MIRDFVHACRSIGRMPIVAAVIVLSLGAGIGVNTTIFSWLQAIVFQPIAGVRGAGSFYFIEPLTESGGYPGASWLEYRDLSARLTTVEGLAAFRMAPLYVGDAGRTERAYGQMVSGNFFQSLGIRAATGRLLVAADVARPGGEPVVVISHDYWQTHFAGSADVLDAQIRINDRVLTVVGVAPRGFVGTVMGLGFDMWLPATMVPELLPGSRELDDRGIRGYSLMGRLAAGVGAAGAESDVDLAMRDLEAAYPASNKNLRAEVLPFWQTPRGPQRFFASALWFLQIVMLLLLLTVCGNTANLMLGRARARYREVGARLALGATPWRIARLVLTENLILALAGAGVGVLVALWGTEALRAVPMTGAFPIKFLTEINGATLVFAVALALGCGAIFGSAPAVQLARIDALRAIQSGAVPARRRLLPGALLGVQAALAIIVLVVAALFYQSFRDTRGIDPGFKVAGLMLGAYDLTGRAPTDDSSRAFAARLLERLRANPAVEAAAIATSVPLDIHGLSIRSFVLDGRARADGKLDEALADTVTPGYFAAMGIPLHAGTDFADLMDVQAPPQVVVNDEFVRKYLAGSEPIGYRLRSRDRAYTIVGVVRTTTYETFGEPPAACVYYSYRDRPAGAGEVHLRLRGSGGEETLAPVIRNAVRDLDAAMPVYNVRTMAEHIDRNLILRKIPARMFMVLGPLLLALAAIGIYAVVSYAVARRTTEIGVRLALGATPRRVVAGILLEHLRPVAVGAIVGWILIFMIGRQFGDVGLKDAGVLAAVPALLMAVAASACWIPARRAAAVSPSAALRAD